LLVWILNCTKDTVSTRHHLHEHQNSYIFLTQLVYEFLIIIPTSSVYFTQQHKKIYFCHTDCVLCETGTKFKTIKQPIVITLSTEFYVSLVLILSSSFFFLSFPNHIPSYNPSEVLTFLYYPYLSSSKLSVIYIPQIFHSLCT